jgi:hypothetical protein
VDYNISEITKSKQNFISKARPGVTASELTSSPAPDDLTSILAAAIPSNTVGYNAKGIPTAGSMSNLSNTIKSVVNKTATVISNAASSALNGLVNTGKLVLGGSDVVYSNFNNLDKLLKTQAQNFSSFANNQATSIFNTLENSLDTSAISNSMFKSIDETANYSPKKIRDLRYNDKYKQQLKQIVSSSIDNGISKSANLSLDSANYNPIENSGQSALTQLSSPLASGNVTGGIRIKVRRTVYWAKGPGSDTDTALYKSATGRVLKEGISVAVDNNPKNGGIAFLSKVVFDDIGERFAVDWGSDVANRTASGGALPIVDIFFNTKEDAERFANTNPQEVFVMVYPPKSKYTYALNSPPTYGLEA